MNKVRVIACLDMMNGRIVKGVHFAGMKDAGDPAEALARYCAQGVDEIWMLDITASSQNRTADAEMVQNAVRICTVPLCIGGGIRTLDDVDLLMSKGATKVGIGSAALVDGDVIHRASYKYGASAVCALVDVFQNTQGEYEVMDAGQVPTGRLLKEWVKELERLGAGEILLTSMQDGAKTGYDIGSLRTAVDNCSLPVIASGGAGELMHFVQAVQDGGAAGVLAASVFHTGAIAIGAVKEALVAHGIGICQPDFDLSSIRFDEKGLIPAIAQDASTGAVLMLAYMNEESLRLTLDTRLATYYSRSRKLLWVKGKTSGHFQHIREVRYDCDGDAILLKVTQDGAACHTGSYSCFYRSLQTLEGGRTSVLGAAIVQRVYDTVIERKAHPQADSYTNKLLEKGVDKIGKKVVEEAAEVLIAAKNHARDEVLFESADLLYHLTVLLASENLSWDDVYAELESRHR